MKSTTNVKIGGAMTDDHLAQLLMAIGIDGHGRQEAHLSGFGCVTKTLCTGDYPSARGGSRP